MSIESAKAFIDRMKTDDEFNKRVSTAKDKEARMALVKEQGFDFDAEDIQEVSAELNEHDLDQIAGGSGVDITRFFCGIAQSVMGIPTLK